MTRARPPAVGRQPQPTRAVPHSDTPRQTLNTQPRRRQQRLASMPPPARHHRPLCRLGLLTRGRQAEGSPPESGGGTATGPATQGDRRQGRNACGWRLRRQPAQVRGHLAFSARLAAARQIHLRWCIAVQAITAVHRCTRQTPHRLIQGLCCPCAQAVHMIVGLQHLQVWLRIPALRPWRSSPCAALQRLMQAVDQPSPGIPAMRSLRMVGQCVCAAQP